MSDDVAPRSAHGSPAINLTSIRVVTIAMGASVLLALSACGSASSAPPSGAAGGDGVGTGGTNLGTPTVKIQTSDRNQFSPGSATAVVGDIVGWTNGGSNGHNITFDDYAALTGTLGPTDTWQVRFTKAGTYRYHCTIHAPNMTGDITVTSGAAPSAAAPTGAAPSSSSSGGPGGGGGSNGGAQPPPNK